MPDICDFFFYIKKEKIIFFKISLIFFKNKLLTNALKTLIK